MTAPVSSPSGSPAPSLLKRVLVAKPRGYCAGVDRAVLTVEKALEAYGAPVYVRKQIVHNAHVVALQGPSMREKKGTDAVKHTSTR